MLSRLILVLLAINLFDANPIDSVPYDMNSVEFPNIGVFHRTDFFDAIHRPVLFLPDSPDIIATKFLLSTPTEPTNEHEIFNDNHDSIKSSSFDPKTDTKIIVHGFLDDLIMGGWMRKIRDEMHKIGKYNIIIVDWSKGNEPPYGQATVNTRVVGAQIANLIKDIKAVHNTPFESFHIIGHSLGSHIAGYAGERLKTLGRITGLDPAGPFFEQTVPACRLDPTDALFVDSIHTNAHTFGMTQEVSHVDVYPNGGDSQPKCGADHQWLKMLTDGMIEGVKQLTSCNHQRAIDYFIESIRKTNPPVAYECPDYDSFLKGQCTQCGAGGEGCAALGPKVEEWNRFKETGTYHKMFLETKGESPYLLDEYAIKVKFAAANGHANEHGTLFVTLNGNQGSETIQLSKSDEILHLGETYTYVGTTESTVGQLSSVTFKWHHSWTVMTANTYVESIEVSPMFLMNQQRTEATAKFCSSSPDSPITHDKEVEFKKC